MHNGGPVVLVTGVTGAVGNMTLARILEERPSWRVIAPVRTRSGTGSEAWRRVEGLLERIML